MVGVRSQHQRRAQHRKAPRAGIVQFQRHSGRLIVERRGPNAEVKLPRLRGRDADRPQGAPAAVLGPDLLAPQAVEPHEVAEALRLAVPGILDKAGIGGGKRSEEHTSELQSLMRISYAVFCLKKKKQSYQSSKSSMD